MANPNAQKVTPKSALDEFIPPGQLVAYQEAAKVMELKPAFRRIKSSVFVDPEKYKNASNGDDQSDYPVQ